MIARRCLICANINPCPTHSEAAQAAELARNDAAIERIRAAQGPPPMTQPIEAEKTNFAWLIEAPGQNYLSVRELPKMYHEFKWTSDPNKALRFVSEQQADGVMMAVRQLHPDLFAFAVTLGEARPVQHDWIVRLHEDLIGDYR